MVSRASSFNFSMSPLLGDHLVPRGDLFVSDLKETLQMSYLTLKPRYPSLNLRHQGSWMGCPVSLKIALEGDHLHQKLQVK